jgi:uncharacterized protein YjbI with pentapeptide repeats
MSKERVVKRSVTKAQFQKMLEEGEGSVENVCLEVVDLEHVDMSRTVFTNCGFRVVNFASASLLAGTSFVRCQFEVVNFSDAKAEGLVMQNCTLNAVCFARAILTRAKISGSRWTAVDVEGANMDGASIVGGSLTSLNLHKASTVAFHLDSVLSGVTRI